MEKTQLHDLLHFLIDRHFVFIPVQEILFIENIFDRSSREGSEKSGINRVRQGCGGIVMPVLGRMFWVWRLSVVIGKNGMLQKKAA